MFNIIVIEISELYKAKITGINETICYNIMGDLSQNFRMDAITLFATSSLHDI